MLTSVPALISVARTTIPSTAQISRDGSDGLCLNICLSQRQLIFDCIRMEYQPALWKWLLSNFKQTPSLWQPSNPNVLIYSVGFCEFSQMFWRIFIWSKQSQESFSHMCKFMTVDETFLKTQTLLLAVGINGNGNNIPLVWGRREWKYRDLDLDFNAA